MEPVAIPSSVNITERPATGACGRTAQWKILTKKPVGAVEEEISANPGARSARLRAVERLS